MFAVHDVHLGSSKPANVYGSKEEVKANKPHESPVPHQSAVIISGKQFLSLYWLICLQILDTIQVIITLLFFFNINISNNNNQLILSDMDHQNCARKNDLDPPVFTIKPE
jgi:hypothetical protein